MPLQRPSQKLCLVLLCSLLLILSLISVASAQSDGKSLRWMNSGLSPDERASMVVKEMTIDEKKAAGKSEYNGKTYYFCAPSCKAKFDANPSAYVK